MDRFERVMPISCAGGDVSAGSSDMDFTSPAPVRCVIDASEAETLHGEIWRREPSR